MSSRIFFVLADCGEHKSGPVELRGPILGSRGQWINRPGGGTENARSFFGAACREDRDRGGPIERIGRQRLDQQRKNVPHHRPLANSSESRSGKIQLDCLSLKS